MARRNSIEAIIQRCGERLTVHDWYFEECPDNERRSCFYYEFLRGSRIITRLWKRWRDFDPMENGENSSASNRYWTARKCLQRRLKLQRRQFEKCTRILKGPWPDIPWQDLPKDECARRLWEENRAVTIRSDVSSSQLRELAEIISQMALPERAFLVTFPEGVNRKEVVAAFTQAVEHFSRTHRDYFEEYEKGQAGVAPKLRKLGALRLRQFKADCTSKGENVTDEQLVEYQRLTLKAFFKNKPEHRNSREETIDAAVEEKIPYRDWQHLGPAEKDAQGVLGSLIRTAHEARQAAKMHEAEDASELGD